MKINNSAVCSTQDISLMKINNSAVCSKQDISLMKISSSAVCSTQDISLMKINNSAVCTLVQKFTDVSHIDDQSDLWFHFHFHITMLSAQYLRDTQLSLILL